MVTGIDAPGAHESAEETNCDLGPIFIVGCGSSGTHLLASILDGHSSIACGPELWVFNHRMFFQPFTRVQSRLAIWMKSGLVTDWPQEQLAFFTNITAYGHTPASAMALAKSCTTHKEFIDGFYRDFLHDRHKAIWAEKTLGNYRCLDLLLTLYPNARIVHMARNGLDSMVSLMKRGMSPYLAAARWIFDNAGALAWGNDSRYMLLRYEDVVKDTESEVRKLCGHIGVNFEATMITGGNHESRAYWQRFSNGNYHRTWQHRPDRMVTSASVERHLQELSPHAEAVFWGVRLTWFSQRALGTHLRSAADAMAALGYTHSPHRALPRLGLKVQAKIARSYLKRAARELCEHKRIYMPHAFLTNSEYSASPEGSGL